MICKEFIKILYLIAILKVVRMSSVERKDLGENALKRYYEDKSFFKNVMELLNKVSCLGNSSIKEIKKLRPYISCPGYLDFINPIYYDYFK